MYDDLNIGKVLGSISLLVGIAALAVAVGLRMARNRSSPSASDPATIAGIPAWFAPFTPLFYPTLAFAVFLFGVTVWHMITSKSWDNALESVMWLGISLALFNTIRNVRRLRAEALKNSAARHTSNQT